MIRCERDLTQKIIIIKINSISNSKREYLVESYLFWNHANLSSQDVINQKLEIKLRRRWKLFPCSTQNYVVLNAYKSKPSDILLLFRMMKMMLRFTQVLRLFFPIFTMLFLRFSQILKEKTNFPHSILYSAWSVGVFSSSFSIIMHLKCDHFIRHIHFHSHTLRVCLSVFDNVENIDHPSWLVVS